MHPESNPSEEWRNVVGFEGLYLISNQGRVWSIRRNIMRKATPNETRHLCIGLYGESGQKCDCSFRLVHRLVLEAFVGPPPEGMECCHNDGDPTNNRIENLRWDTKKANQADSRRHGTLVRAKGENSGRAKLTADQVCEIRARHAAGEPQTSIVKDYPVGRSSISFICRGEAWTR